MILLVGECTGRKVSELRERGWGRMWIGRGRRIYVYENEPWGFDNGAFGDFKSGAPFDGSAFCDRLHRAMLVGEPYLAVAPDLVQQPDSLQFSIEWRRRLPNSWPWYLALQDGMRVDEVARAIDGQGFVGLFLGGSTAFKQTAKTWLQLAHTRGLRFHYGRAATLARLEYALEIGCDSADSSQFQWSTQKWDSLLYWWDDLRHSQGKLLIA